MKIILYNPYSKKNKSIKIVNKIVKKEKCPYYDITKLDIKDFLDEHPDDEFLIIGGDGTMHHLANDLDGSEINSDIYLYRGGTGNDFSRDFGKKEKHILVNEYIKSVPHASFNDSKEGFINGCGIGLDALVCYYTETSKTKSFFRSTIKGFFKYRPIKGTIIVDGVKHEFNKMYLASIMNGKYEGGGMKMSPKSDRLDDFLEVVVIHNISKLGLLFCFPLIYKGWHIIKKKSVTILQGKCIEIISNDNNYMQLDGELQYNIKRVVAKK